MKRTLLKIYFFKIIHILLIALEILDRLVESVVLKILFAFGKEEKLFIFKLAGCLLRSVMYIANINIHWYISVVVVVSKLNLRPLNRIWPYSPTSITYIVLLTLYSYQYLILGSLIVVSSAIVVWQTNWEYRYYIDPALSIVLVMLILASVWPLLRESALILLQTVPTHIQVRFDFFIMCG